jgi:hypothetical protein
MTTPSARFPGGGGDRIFFEDESEQPRIVSRVKQATPRPRVEVTRPSP